MSRDKTNSECEYDENVIYSKKKYSDDLVYGTPCTLSVEDDYSKTRRFQKHNESICYYIIFNFISSVPKLTPHCYRLYNASTMTKLLYLLCCPI